MSVPDTEVFYRSRIAGFENERRIFAEYIALITPSKGELHVLDWDYRQGIANAESAVKEKERVESELKRLQKEIEVAREQIKQMGKQSDARRTQIERLSELSQPVQKDATYLVMDRYLSRNDAMLQQGSDGPKRVPIGGAVAAEKAKEKERVPSSKLYAKQIRTADIIQLENKLEEETRRVQFVVNDLSLALKEVDEGSARLDIAVTERLEVKRREAANLVNEVDKLDYQGFLSVAELLRLRMKITRAQREEVEELERLQSDKVFFAAKEQQMREQLLADMSLMKRRLRAEASAAHKDFQSQHEALDATLLKLRKREAALSQQEKNSGISYDRLQQTCAAAKERFDRLRRRCALEMEGYNTEARMLKTKLQQLEAMYAKKKAVEAGGGTTSR